MGRHCPLETSTGVSAEGMQGLHLLSVCLSELLFINFSVVNVDMGFMRRK